MTASSHFDTLQRRWLRQLQLEFDEICITYGVQLRSPVFEISDATKELGAWCPDTGTLRLSRHLITRHSWSITIQVLKHEMAHQLCSEKLANAGAPHGKDFQEACELLGVLPEFRRAGTVVPEMVELASSGSNISASGRECMARVEKLLALSQSSNEHEAALALQKANALLEKYHIRELGSSLEYRHGFAVIDRKRKRIESYQRRICSILNDFFHVRVVLSRLYDPFHDDTYKTIEILGTKENVAIAEYCYHFLENRLVQLWSLNKGRFKGSPRTEKQSYYLGLLRGFHDKLQVQRKDKRDPDTQARGGDLVVAAEKQLEIFVGLRFPRLRRVSSHGVKVFERTYSEGVATGKTISFAEGLSSGKKNLAGMLPI